MCYEPAPEPPESPTSGLAGLTASQVGAAPGSITPTAFYIASTEKAYVGQQIDFVGRWSDPGDAGEITEFRWDFGDGTTSSEPDTSHTYAAAGTYTVALSVTDDLDRTDTRATQVTVEDVPAGQTPPVAGFAALKTATRSAGAREVTFDAGDSFDPDGAIVEYRWDFDNGPTAYGPAIERTLLPGAHHPTLTVTDDDGLEHTVRRLDPLVVEFPPDPPVAHIDRTPAGPAPAPATIGFDTTGSFAQDADADIVDYDWDFGDGSTGTGATVDHVYTDAGTYTVTLTVTGTNDMTTTITTQVVVRAPNRGPEAVPLTLETTPDRSVSFTTPTAVADPDGNLDVSSTRVTRGPAHGRVDPTDGGRVVTYTPAAGVNGIEDDFAIEVCDAAGACVTAEIVVVIAGDTAAPTVDAVAVDFSGATGYSLSGEVGSGDLALRHDSNGLRRVSGSAALPGIYGGEARVAFNVNRLAFFPVYIGTIRVADPSAGIDTTTLHIGSIRTTGEWQASGVSRWFDFARLRPYNLDRTVADSDAG